MPLLVAAVKVEVKEMEVEMEVVKVEEMEEEMEVVKVEEMEEEMEVEMEVEMEAVASSRRKSRRCRDVKY
jgi:hypothetical protein